MFSFLILLQRITGAICSGFFAFLRNFIYGRKPALRSKKVAHFWHASGVKLGQIRSLELTNKKIKNAETL